MVLLPLTLTRWGCKVRTPSNATPKGTPLRVKDTSRRSRSMQQPITSPGVHLHVTMCVRRTPHGGSSLYSSRWHRLCCVCVCVCVTVCVCTCMYPPRKVAHLPNTLWHRACPHNVLHPHAKPACLTRCPGLAVRAALDAPLAQPLPIIRVGVGRIPHPLLRCEWAVQCGPAQLLDPRGLQGHLILPLPAEHTRVGPERAEVA